MEKDLKKAVERLCPNINERVRDDFLSRMDPEYLSLYSPEEIVQKAEGGKRVKA